MTIGVMLSPVTNEPRHPWYQKRNHVRIPKRAESKKYLDAAFVGAGGAGGLSGFGNTAPPTIQTGDNNGYTIGVVARFLADVTVTGIRWYSADGDIQALRKAWIWDIDTPGVAAAGGEATVTPGGNKWITIPLSAPFDIDAGDLFVFGIVQDADTSGGTYGVFPNLGVNGVINGPVEIMRSTDIIALYPASSGNGRYKQGGDPDGTYPDGSFNDTGYGVDVEVQLR